MSKTVLITGGSRGIGKGAAELFHKNGYNVVINYNKSEKEALSLAESLPGSIAVQGDVSKEEEVKAFNKIEYVYQELEFQPNMEYEELILNLHRTKILLNESLETIKKYKNNDYNYNSWRFPETSSKDIFGRYHSRENWPFNIFRD